MQTFGQKIEEKLNLYGITQKKLADLAGVNVTYINKILKDKTTNPSFGVVRRIAKALNINDAELDYLFQLNYENRITHKEEIKQTLTIEEKQSINEINEALIKTDLNDIKNLATIIKKISDFQQLRQKYYVVARIDAEMTHILPLNNIDEDFLRLYSYCFKDFLIVKDIVRKPDNAVLITINDLLDILNSVEEDYDAIELKEYIEDNM